MAKPEDWRREFGRYPFSVVIPTRFQDVDLLGHINNVAMAGLFEEGRGRFNRSLGLHRGSKEIRWLIAGVDLAYLAEAHYPLEATIASGIGRVGKASWVILSAAFQEGRCVATCDTTIVYTDADGAKPVPDDFRAKFASMKAF